MEPTQAEINAYVAAIIGAGIPVEELIKELLILGVYSRKMIAEAGARIARSEGQAAQQQVEAAVQVAEAAAAQADQEYLDLVKQIAAAR
jgi:hypothetical protein